MFLNSSSVSHLEFFYYGGQCLLLVAFSVKQPSIHVYVNSKDSYSEEKWRTLVNNNNDADVSSLHQSSSVNTEDFKLLCEVPSSRSWGSAGVTISCYGNIFVSLSSDMRFVEVFTRGKDGLYRESENDVIYVRTDSDIYKSRIVDKAGEEKTDTNEEAVADPCLPYEGVELMSIISAEDGNTCFLVSTSCVTDSIYCCSIGNQTRTKKVKVTVPEDLGVVVSMESTKTSYIYGNTAPLSFIFLGTTRGLVIALEYRILPAKTASTTEIHGLPFPPVEFTSSVILVFAHSRRASPPRMRLSPSAENAVRLLSLIENNLVMGGYFDARDKGPEIAILRIDTIVMSSACDEKGETFQTIDSPIHLSRALPGVKYLTGNKIRRISFPRGDSLRCIGSYRTSTENLLMVAVFVDRYECYPLLYQKDTDTCESVDEDFIVETLPPVGGRCLKNERPPFELLPVKALPIEPETSFRLSSMNSSEINQRNRNSHHCTISVIPSIYIEKESQNMESRNWRVVSAFTGDKDCISLQCIDHSLAIEPTYPKLPLDIGSDVWNIFGGAASFLVT